MIANKNVCKISQSIIYLTFLSSELIDRVFVTFVGAVFVTFVDTVSVILMPYIY